MMDILYSCPLDPVKLAAPGYHVINVANELSKQGCNVTLIHQGTTLQDVEVNRQIPLQLVRRGALSVLWLEIKYAFAINRILRSRKPGQSVYHRYAKWSFLPFAVFGLRRSRVILEVNADLDSELISMSRSSVIRRLCLALEYLQVRRSQQVIVVSEGIQKSMGLRYPAFKDKIHVVENGTDIKTFFPRDRDSACESLGLDPHYQYVTSVSYTHLTLPTIYSV